MGKGKTLCAVVSRIDPRKSLPIFHKLFFVFFPFFVFFCLHHPAVVVREIVLYSFFFSLGFMNSLMSSSHLLLGLPTNLLVLFLLSSPGSQSIFFWSIFLLVGMLFYLPFATSVFCVFQSSKVSSFSPCNLLLLGYLS